ncbi:hypothetical protein FHT97_004502 [Rhizobium sp. BK399]|nr:hypothetical protein [Rhizobium sp. BK399]
MTSVSPAFSRGVPGLIHRFVAHILEPQDAIFTRAFPSPLAHCPVMSAAATGEAMAKASIAKIANINADEFVPATAFRKDTSFSFALL